VKIDQFQVAEKVEKGFMRVIHGSGVTLGLNWQSAILYMGAILLQQVQQRQVDMKKYLLL